MTRRRIGVATTSSAQAGPSSSGAVCSAASVAGSRVRALRAATARPLRRRRRLRTAPAGHRSARPARAGGPRRCRARTRREHPGCAPTNPERQHLPTSTRATRSGTLAARQEEPRHDHRRDRRRTIEPSTAASTPPHFLHDEEHRGDGRVERRGDAGGGAVGATSRIERRESSKTPQRRSDARAHQQRGPLASGVPVPIDGGTDRTCRVRRGRDVAVRDVDGRLVWTMPLRPGGHAHHQRRRRRAEPGARMRSAGDVAWSIVNHASNSMVAGKHTTTRPVMTPTRTASSRNRWASVKRGWALVSSAPVTADPRWR